MTSKDKQLDGGKKAEPQVVAPKRTRKKKDDTPYVPPAKLSKMAIWLREHGPAFRIVDWKAVMK